MRLACLHFVLLILVSATAQAGDWPQFLGPNGNGLSDEEQAPTQWGPDENIRWKFPLPQGGDSSPIVSGGCVFITCAQDRDGKQRSLYCLDRKTGKQLWVKTIDFGVKMPTHNGNPYCGSTPASDGKRVVTFEGSAGLHCYDFEGKELWNRDLGEVRHQWGYASSPVIRGNRVYLNRGPGDATAMMCFDLENGETLWKTDEVLNGKKLSGTWSTPIFANVGGKEQLVVVMPTRVLGYDPENGTILWFCEGIEHSRGRLAYSSAMVSSNGLCVAIGGYRGPGLAVQIDGRGDLTPQRLWREENQPQSIGTGVFIDGYLYRPNDGRPGSVQCLNPKTGEVVWTSDARGGTWGSIVQAGGRLYLTDKRGATLVFKPNPEKFDLISTNQLGEPSNSTPAFSDGEAFIRTYGGVYCIAEKSE